MVAAVRSVQVTAARLTGNWAVIPEDERNADTFEAEKGEHIVRAFIRRTAFGPCDQGPGWLVTGDADPERVCGLVGNPRIWVEIEAGIWGCNTREQ